MRGGLRKKLRESTKICVRRPMKNQQMMNLLHSPLLPETLKEPLMIVLPSVLLISGLENPSQLKF